MTNLNRSCAFLIVLVLFAESAPAVAAERRTWTSADGKFNVEADLVDYSDRDIRLKRIDGNVVTVPWEKIGSADKSFVRGSADSVYRLEGFLQVRNHRPNSAWAILTRQEQDGQLMIVLQNGTDLDHGIVQLTPQPLTQPEIATNKRMQFELANLYVESTDGQKVPATNGTWLSATSFVV